MIIHCTQGTESWWCTCIRQIHRWTVVFKHSCVCVCLCVCVCVCVCISACECVSNMYVQSVVHMCKIGACNYTRQQHEHLNRGVRQTQLTHVATNDRWNMVTLLIILLQLSFLSCSNPKSIANPMWTHLWLTNLFRHRIHHMLNTDIKFKKDKVVLCIPVFHCPEQFWIYFCFCVDCHVWP